MSARAANAGSALARSLAPPRLAWTRTYRDFGMQPFIDHINVSMFLGCKEDILGLPLPSQRDPERLPLMTADATTSSFIQYQTPAILNPVVLKLTLQRQTWDQRPCSRLIEHSLSSSAAVHPQSGGLLAGPAARGWPRRRCGS